MPDSRTGPTRAGVPSKAGKADARPPSSGGRGEAVSLYFLHRCVWDHVRSAGVSSGAGQAYDITRYELTDEERTAFETRDIAKLYQLGLHPVLLNGFCRASGYDRDAYREVLQVFATPQVEKARWQR
jgi:hypothetical protein